mmetsp:Transcript_58186/g.112268  ORF Transcript_58186/g.112268 Transcript_58186/m.112268 type:complete len:244 (+) Transcript_58186:151-882(+)
MLLAFLDLTLVHPTVWPLVHAHSRLLSVHILPRVLAAIRKGKASFAVHFAVFPLTVIPAPISPHINAFAMERIEKELAVIGTASLRALVFNLTLAALCPLHILSSEGCTIWKGYAAITMLLPRNPLTAVNGAICQRADALSMCHVIYPRPNIHAAVGILERAQTVCTSLAEFTAVFSAVWPNLEALAVGLPPSPLARVFDATWEGIFWPLLKLPLGARALTTLVVQALLAVRTLPVDNVAGAL